MFVLGRVILKNTKNPTIVFSAWTRIPFHNSWDSSPASCRLACYPANRFIENQRPWIPSLGGGLKQILIFTPISNFDSYFSDGLFQPPTSLDSFRFFGAEVGFVKSPTATVLGGSSHLGHLKEETFLPRDSEPG